MKKENNNKLWRCPRCETMNTGKECVVCGHQSPVPLPDHRSYVKTALKCVLGVGIVLAAYFLGRNSNDLFAEPENEKSINVETNTDISLFVETMDIETPESALIEDSNVSSYTDVMSDVITSVSSVSDEVTEDTGTTTANDEIKSSITSKSKLEIGNNEIENNTSVTKNKDNELSPINDSGDRLTILCWTGRDLEPMIKMFCKEKGYSADQVTWTQVGTNGGEANEWYEWYFMRSEDCDLFVAESDWILKYINNDEYSVPLSALGISENQYKDAFPYTVAIGKNSDGVLKGASWQSAAGGYVYRKDLAEQYLDVHSPAQMQIKIGDWDKFQESAVTVNEASRGKTAMAATIGGLWQVFSFNRGEPWVKDNKLVLDNAADFVNMAKSFSDNKYVTGVHQWTDAWFQVGQDDSTMGYFYSTWCLTNDEGSQLYQAEGGKNGNTYGKYNICVGPTNFFWGGCWLVPSTKCNNKTMAKEFIEFFTINADSMKKYAESSGDFVNNKSVMQAIVDAGTNKNDLLDGQDQFSVLIDAAAGIKMDGLITPYDATIKSNFIDSVNNYINGYYDSTDATLEGFKDEVKDSYSELIV